VGINKQVLKLLLHENSYKEIVGDYLSIGKQTVNVQKEEMFEIFSNSPHNQSLKEIYKSQNFDNLTRQAGRIEIDTILDHDLLKCISQNALYHCLDRSDYEGADIICDMNNTLPAELENRFDFIYNGSVMDNIFDPVSFVINTTKMLKPGGRIMHIECSGGVPGAYLMHSPEWFFSYYAINDFVDCKIYITIATEEGEVTNFFDTDLYTWNPYFTRDPNYKLIEACKSINNLMHVIVIAEKGENSSSEKRPIQMQYLDENCVDWRKKYHEYSSSKRPILSLGTKKDNIKLPYLSDHYSYIGSGF